MNLQEILEHRRAVRYYDASKPIDADRVEACVRLATLAPTSLNMQLWEAYHVTDRATIDRLVPACMGQAAVKTAQQLVVFVVRPDLWKAHAESVLAANEENIRKTFPEAKWEKYAGLQRAYYRKIVPFLYSRCFGVWGLCRKVIANVTGLFSPHCAPSDGERYVGGAAQELRFGSADLYVGDERSGLRHLSARRFRFGSREESARFALCGAGEHDCVMRRS